MEIPDTVSVLSAWHGAYMDRMSRLRRQVLYDLDIFVTVDCLTEFAGVDAAEQEKQCGVTIDRMRLPADEKART
jgi:hypothetical protein